MRAVASANASSITPSQRAALDCFERTFKCYIMEDPSARAMKEELTSLEGALEGARNAMSLGYADPLNGGKFVAASSVQLRTTMRTHANEAVRKACFEGIGAVGAAVAPGLVAVVALRNKLARAQGFVDYYDMKVTQAEARDVAGLLTWRLCELRIR